MFSTYLFSILLIFTYTGKCLTMLYLFTLILLSKISDFSIYNDSTFNAGDIYSSALADKYYAYFAVNI